MAATKDKYSHNVRMLSHIENGVVVNKKARYQPLALQEYQNDARFKELFYVDEVKHKKDSDNKNIVIGLLEENSANLVRHSAARIGYHRCKYQVGGAFKSFLQLNDGGLNTMADCGWVNTKGVMNGEFLALFANYIRVTCRLSSAYYVDTTSLKIKLRIPAKSKEWNITIPTGVQGGGLPAKQEIAVLGAELKDLDIEENDLMYFTISATNAEGTYTNPTELYSRAEAPAALMKVYRWDSLPPSTTDPREGTPYTIVLNKQMWAASGAGNILYDLFRQMQDVDIALSGGEQINGVEGEDITNELFTTPLPDGYYFGIPTTYNGADYKFVRLTSNGWALAWYENNYSPTWGCQVIMELLTETIGSNVKFTIRAFLTGDVPQGGVRLQSIVRAEGNNLGPEHEDRTYTSNLITTEGGSILGSFTLSQTDLEVVEAFRTITTVLDGSGSVSRVTESRITF